MSRDIAGIYAPPPGTAATTQTTIDSAKYNGFVADITAEQNAKRPVSAGGTGGGSPSEAQVGLSLVPGTHVQEFNAKLNAIAALSPIAGDAPYFTGAAAAALMTTTAYGRSLLAVAAESTFKALVNLEAGIDVMAQVAGADGAVMYRTGGVWAFLPKGTAGQVLRMNAAGTLPAWALPYAARFQMNGTGTPAVTAGYGIASITDNGVGVYTFNFTTARATNTYGVFVTLGVPPSNNNTIYSHKIIDKQTAFFSIKTLADNTPADFTDVSILVVDEG
jgi:hypothetical protein